MLLKDCKPGDVVNSTMLGNMLVGERTTKGHWLYPSGIHYSTLMDCMCCTGAGYVISDVHEVTMIKPAEVK